MINNLTAVVCDAMQNPFNQDGNGNYIVPFNPAPLGTTGRILLAVSCTLTPPAARPLVYEIGIRNTAEYVFSPPPRPDPAPGIRDYPNTLTQDGVTLYLPFSIDNIVNPAQPADMYVIAADDLVHPTEKSLANFGIVIQ